MASGAEQALLIDKNFVCQQVAFGIYDDKQSFATITEPIEEVIDETALISEDEIEEEDALDETSEGEGNDVGGAF